MAPPTKARVTRPRNTQGSRPKSSGSGGNQNQRAVLTYRPTPTPRTILGRNPFQYVTLQSPRVLTANATKQTIGISKNVFYQGGRPITKTRDSVRRIYRKDPYNKWSQSSIPPFQTGATQATFAPETAYLTTNPNSMFQPMPTPRVPSVIRYPQPVVGERGVQRTHGNVIPFNQFNLTGGKSLRRT